MPQLPRIRPAVAFFWVVLLTLLVFIWPLLPNALSQGLTLLLIGAGLGLLRIQKSDLLLLATIGLLFWAVNEWFLKGSLSTFAVTCIVFTAVTIMGMAVEVINDSPFFSPDRRLIYWTILGLIVAETITLLLYLPISSSGRATVTLIIFYYFWQIFRFESQLTRRFLISHLLFVLVAVILVVGVMIWSGFPQLEIF
jgi:hypothetical protein